MPGILDDQLHVARFHHRATVQHDDVLRDLVRGRQVVRDVDHRDLEVERHLTERPEDRGPERGVHHRHGLVGQDHARPEEERPRHHDALALASRELVRESPERLVGAEPHRAERVLDQRSGPGAGRGQPELGDRHGQDVVHPVERVVDLVRILEDGLDLAPEDPPVRPGHGGEIPPAIGDLALRRRQEAQQEARERRLAAAALADDGGDGRAALGQGEGEVAEGDGVPPVEQPAAEGLGHLARFEDRCHDVPYAR